MGFFKTPAEQFETSMAANDFAAAARLVYEGDVTDMELIVTRVESVWNTLKEKNELGRADQLLYLFDKYLVPTQDGHLVLKAEAPDPEKAALAKTKAEKRFKSQIARADYVGALQSAEENNLDETFVCQNVFRTYKDLMGNAVRVPAAKSQFEAEAQDLLELFKKYNVREYEETKHSEEQTTPRYAEQFSDETNFQTTDYIPFEVCLVCLLSMGLGVIVALYYWINDQAQRAGQAAIFSLITLACLPISLVLGPFTPVVWLGAFFWMCSYRKKQMISIGLQQLKDALRESTDSKTAARRLKISPTAFDSLCSKSKIVLPWVQTAPKRSSAMVS
jgi:hypothetical protein